MYISFSCLCTLCFVFFFIDPPPSSIYTLSLHDALPISRRCVEACVYGTLDFVGYPRFPAPVEFIAADSFEIDRKSGSAGMPRPISYAVFCLKKKRAFAGKCETRRQRRSRPWVKAPDASA